MADQTEIIEAPQGTLAFLTRVMAGIPAGAAPGVAQAFIILQQCKPYEAPVTKEMIGGEIGEEFNAPRPGYEDPPYPEEVEKMKARRRG